MNVAAGQTARPSISTISRRRREKINTRLAKQAICLPLSGAAASFTEEAMATPEELKAQAQRVPAGSVSGRRQIRLIKPEPRLRPGFSIPVVYGCSQARQPAQARNSHQ